MQDLIERRAALTALCEDCLQKYEGICPHPVSRCVEFRTIKQLPAIDAEPVRHGRWIYGGYDEYPTCSYCKQSDTYAGDYCGNCGTRMDGGVEDG